MWEAVYEKDLCGSLSRQEQDPQGDVQSLRSYFLLALKIKSKFSDKNWSNTEDHATSWCEFKHYSQSTSWQDGNELPINNEKTLLFHPIFSSLWLKTLRDKEYCLLLGTGSFALPFRLPSSISHTFVQMTRLRTSFPTDVRKLITGVSSSAQVSMMALLQGIQFSSLLQLPPPSPSHNMKPLSLSSMEQGRRYAL